MKQFTTSLGIDQNAGPAYCPQAQGIVEQMNHTLISCIYPFVREKPQSWSKYLPAITFAINTSVNSSIKQMPFFLLFGYQPTFPSEYVFPTDKLDIDTKERLQILKEVREKIPAILQTAQQKQKQYFDRNKQHIELAEGDLVLIKKILIKLRHTISFLIDLKALTKFSAS